MNVHSSFLRVIAFAARARGVDVAGLAAEVGLGVEQLVDVELRPPFAMVLRLWKLAAERAGDPAFGLHAAEDLHRSSVGGMLSLLDYVTITSADLEGAIARFCRFTEILGDRRVALVAGSDASTVSLRTTWRGGGTAEALRHHSEYSAAFAVLRGRAVTGVQVAPRVARFAHAAPASLAEHLRVMGAPCEFGAPIGELVFDRALLALPLRTADPVLCATLEREARELVGEAEPLTERVAREIARALPSGQVELAGIARALHMAPRTLQRRLERDGTSFAALVDAMRKSLALRHLSDGMISVAETAFMVGYSEPTAFHRAFHRWTGTSPRAFRRRGVAGAGAASRGG